MRVLVAYASRYAATKGIAERVASTLRQQEIEATATPAQQAGDPAGYDAAVIGSAVYYFHWMKPAKDYVWRYSRTLGDRPVWLFSSGPLGTKDKDDQGRDLREFLEPKEIAGFREALEPRDHRVFFGAFEPAGLSFTHKLIYKLPANRDNALFPVGDFRNWTEIEAWANSIAQALKAA
jgi:menaquinone-dependent protoporphyrinogen oxidase